MKQIVKKDGLVLCVSTNPASQDLVENFAKKFTFPYAMKRWLGGTLTNFKVMQQSIKRMKEISEFLDSEKSKSLIKKERLNLERQFERMRIKFGGLLNMNKLPDAIFVIDPHFEKGAVREAKEFGIKIFAILDTNSDPSDIDYVIPANDDAKKSVEMIMNLVKEAILEGAKKTKIDTNSQIKINAADPEK